MSTTCCAHSVADSKLESLSFPIFWNTFDKKVAHVLDSASESHFFIKAFSRVLAIFCPENLSNNATGIAIA